MTQSLLGRYLCCPERLRISYVEGLRPVQKYSHRVEFGNCWHRMEELFAGCGPEASESRLASEATYLGLVEYTKELFRKYPLQQQEIEHWYNVCRVTFPEYVKHWAAHPDVKARTPLLQEYVFSILYPLPSGRTVRLRGKFDAVDLIDGGVWLFETKTKGDVDEEQIQRQMLFDLQTCIYLVSLKEGLRQHMGGADVGLPEEAVEWGHRPILGVRYNVIRRPLSGGKGSIVRHKGKAPAKLKSGKWGKGKAEESLEAYYARLAAIIRAEPASYFYCWNVAVGSNDLDRFRRQCLDPILENLCDDYEWWSWCHRGKGGVQGSSVWDYLHRHKRFPHHQARSYRFPYGVSNPLTEGYGTEMDSYLDEGTLTGLYRTSTLFEELR